MKYAFGVNPSDDIKKQFIDHHNVCIACKNADTYSTKEEEIKDGKVVDTYYVRACQCGATWIPREPTEENIKDFIKFKNEISI